MQAACPLPEVGAVEFPKDRSDWPDPVLFNEGTPAVEPLLPEMLPEAFRPWLCDVAERMNVPLDYPAAAAIVALSAVVGRRVQNHSQV